MTNGSETATLRAENEHLRQRVTELEQQTQQQRAQIYRHEQILNILPAMVITKDTHFRLTYGNTAFRELYGMSQAELQGMIDAAFNDPAYTAQYVADDTHVLQTGQTREVEEPVTRHDGVVRTVQTIKAPLYNEAGQIDALVGVLTDVTERKQAHAALKELNAELEQQAAEQTATLQTFKTLVENAPDAIVITDAAGVLTYVNPAFRTLYGYGREAIGMMIPAFFPETEQAHLAELLAHIQEHNLWQGVLTHQRKDGSHFIGEESALVIRNAQGTVQAMGAIVRDITVRKQQEEDLRRSEIRLQALLDAIPDMMLRVSQEHIFLDYREAQDIDAYVPPEVFLGKHVTDVLPPDVAESIIQTGTEVLRSGERQMIEYQLAMSDGLHSYDTWVVASADNTYLLLIRDSTERKQQEQELLNVNERLRFILEGSQDGAWDANLQAGEFYYSPRFAEMMGYHPDELAPSIETWMSNIHPDDVAKVNQALQDYLMGQTPVYEYEHRLGHKSGAWLWVLARGKVTLRDEQGNPVRMAGTISDITQRKRQEEELIWFGQAIESTSDLIGISDIQGQSRYHNQAFIDRLGYTPAELNAAGGPPAIYTDPQQATEVFTALQQGRSWTGEITLRSKAGEIVPMLLRADVIRNDADQAIGFIGVQTDITEQKRQQEALQMFKTLVENAPDAISVATLEGVEVYANPIFQERTGYGEQVIGKRVPDLYDESPEIIQQIVQYVIEQGYWQGENNYCRPDGQTLPNLASIFLVNDEAGNPRFTAAIERDLTPQREAEAERAALQQQIIDAQRDALRELSSPLIPITDEVVIMPLIGTIDSRRAQQVMETLLEGIAQHQADLVILDITGVSVVDTQVAQAFIQAAHAVRLLGAQVMLTGIQPQIAQTLVHLGVDLSNIITRGSLQAGIATALENVSNGQQKSGRQR
ncbi:MAG: PAS domain S-box protein [Chloroflexaceae bacterium]